MKKIVTLAIGLSLIASVALAGGIAPRNAKLAKFNKNAPTVTLDNKMPPGAVLAGAAALGLIAALTSGSSSASSSSSGASQ